MSLEIIEENGFKYVVVGQGPIIMNLHGLFGALSNFKYVTDFLAQTILSLSLYCHSTR